MSNQDYDSTVLEKLYPVGASVAAPDSSRQNPSGLHPRGIAVLVEPYEPEKLSSIIAIPDNVRQSMMVADQRAVVIEVGSEAWSDERKPRARPGERVMIAKFSGVMIVGPKDGRQYRMVNDRDIYCVIEEDEK